METSRLEVCPVCKGKGLVPNGFYAVSAISYTTSSTGPETCRSCGGRGFIQLATDDYLTTYSSDKHNCKCNSTGCTSRNCECNKD